MELALLVYLIGFVDSLGFYLTSTIVLSLLTVGGASLAYCAAKAQMFDKQDDFFIILVKKLIKASFVTLVTCSIVHVVIPNKNTVVMMIGAYAGQVVIENPKTSELFDKSLKAIEAQLDVLIAPPKKEEKKE